MTLYHHNVQWLNLFEKKFPEIRLTAKERIGLEEVFDMVTDEAWDAAIKRLTDVRRQG